MPGKTERVGGNYLWFLLIVKFMRIEGAKRLGGRGGSKVIIWGRANHKRGDQFLLGVDSSGHHRFE